MCCSYVEGTCGQEKKKGSGIGDFHNYASQHFATIQLTVFFLPANWACSGLPLHSAPSPAFSNPSALSHFTISKWFKKKISIFFLIQQMAGLRNLVEIRLSDFLINFSVSHKKQELILILMLNTIWHITLGCGSFILRVTRQRDLS